MPLTPGDLVDDDVNKDFRKVIVLYAVLCCWCDCLIVSYFVATILSEPPEEPVLEMGRSRVPVRVSACRRDQSES